MADGSPASASVHRVGIDFTFSASHRLDGLRPGHKCSRLHGHTYTVMVEIDGVRDDVGFVVDFGDLAWVGALIADRLDHQHLNDVLPGNPTSENLATWVLDQLTVWLRSREDAHRFTRAGVTVSESPRTRATAWESLT